MSTPDYRLKTTRLRLQTQLENIAFTLANAPLSDEQRALLQSQLAAVQDELVKISGGVSLN
jgi:hypothetical protein